MDISIIIPAYNAEKYLERCLKSVLRALTAAERASGEIIVVDNGSRDKTLMVARKWRKTMATEAEAAKVVVRVLQCHTPGAAAARNYGALEAQGTYLWFVDADDEITEDSVEKLLLVSARGKPQDKRVRANMVMMGVERVYPDGHRDYLSAVTRDDPDWISRFIRYGVGPWQVMVRRHWWLENGFKFREGAIHEDMELMSFLILRVKRKFEGVDLPLYLYHQNAESVLHKSKFNPQIFDIFPALAGLYEKFAGESVSKYYLRRHPGATGVTAADEWHDELEWFFIWNLLIDSAKDFGAFPEGHAGFAQARKMLSDYFPAWRKNRFLREKSLRLQMRVRLNYSKQGK